MFCGSYEPDDIAFLLKPISMNYTDVWERERIMQVEGKHYSEMIPKEYLPSAQYKAVFYTALALNKHKLAQHILALAKRLNEKENMTFIFSTHDSRVMERAKRLVSLDDGKIVNDKIK